ncbi:unnamed protein product [Gongylonema pulchrum]|uniref:DH domain-containing protein n=1 Tax=Gongylonema pulchrum TaxID=637853 RepID=A0A183DNH3_9BILA|nr:unnamed protein product [Gongylonema pulchrum]
MMDMCILQEFGNLRVADGHSNHHRSAFLSFRECYGEGIFCGSHVGVHHEAARALYPGTVYVRDNSLAAISNNCHPGIALDQAAAEHIQDLLIRLFFGLLESRPQSIEDTERSMHTTLPASMFHWWTGNYVKNIRKCNPSIGLQNLKIALSADTSLMELTEMLYNEEEASTAGILNDNVEDIVHEMTYDKASRDFKHEEEQYLRELSLIVHVFRRRFETVLQGSDKHYLDEMFANVLELHELTVKVQRMLEDAIEMSDTPCVGSGLWELAEAQEFDVYITYMNLFKGSLTAVTQKVLNDSKYKPFFQGLGLLSTDDEVAAGFFAVACSKCPFFQLEDRTHSVTPGGKTFRLAVKYVLPSLMTIPVVHFFRYVEMTNILCHLARPSEEIEDLKSAKSYFCGLAAKIESLCPLFLITRLKTEQSVRALPESNRSRQLRRIQEIQRSIEAWDGKEIGYTCAEVVREGDLSLLRTGPMSPADTLKKSRGVAVRHTFLFDHLLVLCKTLRPSKSERPVYKFKDKILIRKTDIFDLKDTEELQNAFKIISRPICHERGENVSWVLFCQTPEEKISWMSDLVRIQTKSSLDRMLDASLKEEEKLFPLILPTPEQYSGGESLHFRFADQDCDENIVFEDYTSSAGIPVVKHGTVLKLVERLTYHLYTDNNFVRTFLTTYRSFCTAPELLELLIERFRVPTPIELQVIEDSNCLASMQTRELLDGRYALSRELFDKTARSYQRFRKEYQRPIQCRVLSVIRQWVIKHWYDFENDSVLLDHLCAFLDETDSHGKVINQYKKWCKSIKTCIERKKRADAMASSIQQSGSGSEPTSPLTPSCYGPQKPKILWHTAEKGAVETYDLLTLHPIEIGRQVTLLQFDLYRAIKPIELVGSAWTKRDKDRRSPQLLKLIDHSTMLTYWVARAIVETPSLEERVYMFSRVLDVMAVFEELNNFTGLVALYSALNSSSVYRLKACWERMDREKQTSYEKFKKLCNPHWKEMIERLKSINPPCVPFFGKFFFCLTGIAFHGSNGHYLSKIFFYEEGNSTFVQSEEDLAHDQLNGSEGNASIVGVASRKVMVSFVKCRRIAAIISDIQMYQNQPYALEVEPSIRVSVQ